MVKGKKSIIVNFDDIKSIRRAEKMKLKYENQGYTVFGTISKGINKFELKMKKVV